MKDSKKYILYIKHYNWRKDIAKYPYDLHKIIPNKDIWIWNDNIFDNIINMKILNEKEIYMIYKYLKYCKYIDENKNKVGSVLNQVISNNYKELGIKKDLSNINNIDITYYDLLRLENFFPEDFSCQ